MTEQKWSYILCSTSYLMTSFLHEKRKMSGVANLWSNNYFSWTEKYTWWPLFEGPWQNHSKNTLNFKMVVCSFWETRNQVVFILRWPCGLQSCLRSLKVVQYSNVIGTYNHGMYKGIWLNVHDTDLNVVHMHTNNETVCYCIWCLISYHMYGKSVNFILLCSCWCNIVSSSSSQPS